MADLMVRVAWVAAGAFVVCDVAKYVYTAKALSAMNNQGLTARLLENVKNSAVQFAFWPVASAVAGTVVTASIAVLLAHLLRTMVWIAVRNGAVPGQGSRDDTPR